MALHPPQVGPAPLLPFLKWAGGKRKLASTILGALGPGRRLIEPFVGAGAVFGASNYPTAFLGDCNPDLLGLYRALQSEARPLIEECRRLFALPGTSETYLTQRALFNASAQGLSRAALFLYLNHRGYNGLCRYNQRGKFNVPFGGPERTTPLPETLLQQWSARLQGVELACCDFEEAMESAQEGDVVYCDPPYAPLHSTEGFTSYAPGGFTWGDQVRLATAARRIAQRGVVVAISNHDTKATRELYAGSVIVPLSVPRHIGSRADCRKRAAELLVLQGPHRCSIP